jgi:prepilin signal peptidase PulO-like enzyme (type II secretory pathway)
MVSMQSASLLVVLFAVIGAVLGSFGNVLIFRFGQAKWVAGRSKCPACKSVLHWYDLVPVASYVFLGGKCRSCKRHISAQYPLVELACAGIFLLALHRLQDAPLLAGLSGGVLYLVFIAALIDARHRQLPDILSLGIASIGVLSSLLYGSLLDACIGALIGAAWFGWQWLVSRGQWVGSGDILLAGALGLWLGSWPTVAMLVLAYGCGAAWVLLLLTTTKTKLRGTRIGFAPFLATGTLLTFLGVAEWYRGLLA